MNCPVSDLLDTAFKKNVPEGIANIVRPEIARPLLTEFKLGVILPWGKPSATRIAISAQGERDTSLIGP